MQRAAFEELVAGTAQRPRGAADVRRDLEGQLCYQAEPHGDALDELAAALTPALHGRVDDALPALADLAHAHPRQPLCQLYWCAALLEAGHAQHVGTALGAWRQVDPSDPMAELLALALADEEIPGITEQRRLANLAKFAATPLLRNPYRLAVRSIFEVIRDREGVRVLDVGVGSGAQMCALVDLLGRESHGVRRIEIVGLDFVESFLAAAGDAISDRAAPLTGRVDVRYRPVPARIDALSDAELERLVADGPLDAVNATIALHEVSGEAKLDALHNIRRLAPARFVLAEWNYCLENTLPETSVEFIYNTRRFLSAMVAALRERHHHAEARAVARDWLSMAGGQLTCPAPRRQECFLDATTWIALLERAGFAVAPPRQELPAHADPAGSAWIDDSYVATSRYANGCPVALIEASPFPDPGGSTTADEALVLLGEAKPAQARTGEGHLLDRRSGQGGAVG